ncbi:MAG: DUF3343 domain-containing protein [Ezakiella sp.]|nr:DUF3343 domain-containing protein [Ezakiella sp.]MDD7761386.1 DUF3343 domain-containing protein [Bacillota bacterium]MDY3946926.1 DUF3343 domain-containing protein [Ezakiella sp.]
MYVITFHQMTDALMMEKLGKAIEPDFRLIPVPRQISSSCGLAAQTSLDLKTIEELIATNKIDADGIYEKDGHNYTVIKEH